jgi:Raf kinase inhibitor-like YbhB/YbcL family protein
MSNKVVKMACLLMLVPLLLLPGAGAFAESTEDMEGGSGSMDIQSNAFKEGDTIPKKHTCDAEDVSPQLSWSAVPDSTESLAMICDDPDAPVGTWVHWVLFNLPPETNELPEGVPDGEQVLGGAAHGRNDFGALGYGGPCPPPGPAHRYFFKLYALDTDLALQPGATKADVIQAMEGHIVAEGQLMGQYGR